MDSGKLTDKRKEKALSEELLENVSGGGIPFTLRGSYKIYPHLCEGCGRCAEVCSVNAIRKQADGTYKIDASLCSRCGTCVTETTCRAIAVS